MARKRASPDQLELALGLEKPLPSVSRGKGAAWAVPEYSNSRVDKAGRLLAAEDAPEDAPNEALLVINSWRSSHSFPLNTFQVGLRYRARHVDEHALLAQRIKRLSSIQAKLKRMPTWRLSQMQDIGGCRAVVRNVNRVRKLTQMYLSADVKHELEAVDDYIGFPRSSGYRGTHLIYRYFSDKVETYNGLRVEVQLRSQLQHAWATAVETVGTFLKQALKASQGHEQWLRFFSLMGAALAIREHTAPVPEAPSGPELTLELRDHVKKLDVAKKLKSYGAALETVNRGSLRGAHYYLLALDPGDEKVWVAAYPKYQLEKATADYLTVERAMSKRSGAEVVLVSVESVATLRRAYPNYFLDTRVFIDAVNNAVAI